MLIMNISNNAKSMVNHLTVSRIKKLSDLRWSERLINDWYSHQEWPCGFNFLPSSAVNFIEMWNEDTFDRDTIQREFGWAKKIGFNSVRTNISFTVWQVDPKGLIKRISEFLDICNVNNLKAVLCLFDDCGFSGEAPHSGKQEDPIIGVHNSRAIASPGRRVVINHESWPELQSYTQSILTEFKDSPNILFWDLYNEPGNLMIFKKEGQTEGDHRLEPASLELIISVFEWARRIDVMQPLTIGAWHVQMPWEIEFREYFDHPIDELACQLSDLISFHCYKSTSEIRKAIEILEVHNRPIMCTEWMARTLDSRIMEQLPLMNKNKIGSWQWGLVQGRTQTHIPWPAIKENMTDYNEETSEWFHDLLYPDGRAYDPKEVDLIQSLTHNKNINEV